MNKVSDTILSRIYLLLACFILFAGVIVAQILRLQVGQGKHWAEVAGQIRVYPKPILADRGSILADDGSILAITLPFYQVAMDVTVLHRRDYVSFDDTLDLLCTELARHFGHGRDGAEYSPRFFRSRILKAMDAGNRHVLLFPYSRSFNYSELKLLRQFPILNRGQFKGGLILDKVNNKRFYPFGDMARVTLGYVRDSMAYKGLEAAFSEQLKGQDGTMLVERIPGNVEVPLSEYGDSDSKDGYDLQTTLNINMQDVATNALREGVLKNEALGGVAIVMEVSTGEIKALANFPENLNAAVGVQQEPGSTFKLASVMAALEDGVAQPTDTVQTGKGNYTYYDRTMHDVAGHGQITFKQAFEYSSNIGISRIISNHYKNYPERFLTRLDEMGILTPTGSQMKGEPAPYVIRPKDKMWNGTTLPWLSTGYNVRLTPLQMLTFYNAVANDGKMISPVIVRQVKNNAEVIKTYETNVIREHICSAKTLATVRSFLEGVVEEGTATNIKSAQYRIAGKTGTCLKLINGKYEKRYRASFVGYFPADKPKYSCIVVIDEPSKGEIYGAKVAGPIFKQIADNVYSASLKPEDVPDVRYAGTRSEHYPVTRQVNYADARLVYNELSISAPNQPNAEFVKAWQQGATVVMTPSRQPHGTVPDVIGMSSKDAVAVLENLGMRVRLQGTGKVSLQSLPAGSRITPGLPIMLSLD